MRVFCRLSFLRCQGDLEGIRITERDGFGESAVLRDSDSDATCISI